MTTATAAAASSADTVTLSPAVETMRRRMTNPFLFKLFLLGKLPMGFLAGLRLDELTPERCRASVPYGYRTKNPFRSTYFAVQAMAAELSTGALAMMAVRAAPASVAMLITGLDAEFGKKATARATFTCEAGPELFRAVEQAFETGEPVTATVETVGRMADGTEVSRFRFTWSFKRRGR